jgi:hypothetical protein
MRARIAEFPGWELRSHRAVDLNSTPELDRRYDLREMGARNLPGGENHGRVFVVSVPAHATAADRITLLDLRAQGVDIAIR